MKAIDLRGLHMVAERMHRSYGVRVPAVAPWIVGVILVLAACGGGDDGADPTAPSESGTNDPSQPTSSTGAPEGSGGLQDQAFSIDQHFWHSGFRVEVVSGEISTTEERLTDEVHHFLTIDATLENTGTESGYFGPAVAVVTSSNSYATSFASELPDVPGGLKGQARFVFEIDGAFDLSSAQLLVGDADEHRAQVPLSTSGDAVRLEPSEPPISGALSMELVDLVFTSAELRYDLPTAHRQVEAGKLALTLYFDAVSRKGGNWQIFAADLALVLPDGNAATPDAIEIGSLAGSDEGVTTPDRYIRFLVDEMPAGDYTLRLAPGSWFVGDDGVTEATFAFTIDG